jgi:pimeloyl-ACP methyl ester carboxylesterase
MKASWSKRWLIALVTLWSMPVLASKPIDVDCVQSLSSPKPVTLRFSREMAIERTVAMEKRVAKPGFYNLEAEYKSEQVRDPHAPLSLTQFFGKNIGFVSTPAPTSADPATINLTDEKVSLPVHVDIPFNGQITSTTAYLSLPKKKSPGEYLIGPEYSVVQFHLHGGGTPTATGKNALSIGEKLAERGYPTVGIDLPGHGRATRNFENLMTLDQQVDWVLAAIDQLVHPSVKVSISGHSWGAMFVLMMHRQSHLPKYRRILDFISLSPGVDITLGGDPKKALEHERWYQQNFHTFKKRIAAGDFEFLDNLLNNGKDSDIGSIITNLFNLRYRTPALTAEESAQLKPISIVVGKYDGIVKVGSDAEYYMAFGGVTREEAEAIEAEEFQLKQVGNLIVMGKLASWKSKTPEDLISTGHQVHDAYIPGTTTPFVLDHLTKRLQVLAQTNPDAAPQSQRLPSSILPHLDATTLDQHFVENMDEAEKVLENTFRHYANFPAFREILEHEVSFVESETSRHLQLTKHKLELDEYLRKVESLQKDSDKIIESKTREGLEKLRAELGFNDPISLARAEQELAAPPLTEARSKELQDYVDSVNKLEAELRSTYVDTQFQNELDGLKTEFAKLIADLNLQPLENYRAYMADFQKSREAKNVDTGGRVADAKQRSELSRLHQKYLAIHKTRQSRFGLERDRLISQLAAPEGISDQRAALRELGMDRSAQRIEILNQFIARYPEVERSVSEQAVAALNTKIAALTKPELMRATGSGQDQSVAQNSAHDLAQKLRDDLVSKLRLSDESGDPELDAIAAQISEATLKRDLLWRGTSGESSLDKLEVEVDKLRVKRAGLVKQWDHLWKGEEVAVSSPTLQEAETQLQKTLEAYTEIYRKYEDQKGNWLLELEQSGRLNMTTLVAFTPELISLRRKTQHGKQVFLEAKDQLEEARVRETLEGRLSGEPSSIATAQRLAQEIWGIEYITSGKVGGLTRQLKLEDEYVESRRRQASLVERERAELRYHYVKLLEKKGLSSPFSIERIPIYGFLNRPVSEVLSDMNRNPVYLEALRSLNSKWEVLLGQLRRVNQSKNDGGY